MKPRSGDHQHRLLISGDELRELQRHTYSMAEAFGLDRKIENYNGTRPITLHRWDLECLIDVIDLALGDKQDYPDQSSPGFLALQRLGERLRHEYDAFYGPKESSLAVRKATAAGAKPLNKVAVGKSAEKQETIYQIKITLPNGRQPIWRRIQVRDCTLDKLHDSIQAAMGWTNGHLHHFKIGKQFYGDPMLMGENFAEMEYKDSTTTKLSDLIPEGGKSFLFFYEYDFGDCWYHKVLVEKTVAAEADRNYPLCVAGKRACPPEDVGGFGGYDDFLKAIQAGDKEMLEWAGGSFDPEAFDLAAATRRMTKWTPE